eukprot:TRINITY_DN1825_c0_g1_i1.p1 TRINITY_DN1825_c0_g1~~TRINITY_DN1825_c0_g1_i1.p1  ORF type:complete len:686 (-),score=200.99 TRINITY_DN1825_c0_g1_i1:262-2319(-)
MDRIRSSSTSSESSAVSLGGEIGASTSTDELSIEALQKKFRPIGNVQEDSFGRPRAPSVADFEVRMLLSNLSSVSESESEADSSELEMEFERVRREGLRSPRTGIHLPKSKANNARQQERDREESEQFWSELKGNLKKQAERLLVDEKSSPSSARGRRKSWMVAAEELEKKLDKPDRVFSPPPQEIQASLPLSPENSIHGEKTDDEFRREVNNESSNLNSLYSSSAAESSFDNGKPLDTETDLDHEMSEDSEEEQPGEESDAMNWWASLKDELEGGSDGNSNVASTSTDPTKNPDPSPVIRTSSNSEVHLSPQPDSKPVLTSTGSNPKLSAVRSKRSSKDPMETLTASGSKSHHRGVLKFDNGTYRGDTESTGEGYNTAQGWGTFQTDGGEFYVGQWSQGKREGMGIKLWEDGRQYVGQWESNRRTGNGIIAWPNGDKYIGDIQFGFQQGHGMFKSADGEKYIGEWNVNERHGYGVMTFKNGDTYSGEWLHNKKDGMGIYRFADGKYVEGQWADNAFVKEKRKSSRTNKNPKGPSDNLDSADMDKDVKNKGRAPSDPRMASPRSEAKSPGKDQPRLGPRFSFSSKSPKSSPTPAKRDVKPEVPKSPVTSPKGSVGRSFLRIASAKELKTKKDAKDTKETKDGKDLPMFTLDSPEVEPKDEKKEKRKMPLPFRRDKTKSRDPEKTL